MKYALHKGKTLLIFLILFIVLVSSIAGVRFESEAIQGAYASPTDPALFSDGLESNDYSAWTSTGGAPATVASPVNSGSYASSMATTGKYAEKTGISGNTIYYRAYVRLNAVAPAGKECRVMALFGGGNILWYLNFQKTSGGILRLHLYQANPAHSDYYYFNWAADTWYCLEVKFVRDATNGEYRVYVDGTERITRTGLDTTRGLAPSKIRIYQTSTYTVTVYHDDVVVDTAYIGPLPSSARASYELGVFDARFGTIIPNESSWVVVNSPDYGGDNLLENPGFERGSVGWGLSKPSSGSPLQVSICSGYKGKSAAMVNNEVGYRGGIYQCFEHVPPKTTFVFSAMIKTVGVVSDAQLRAVALYVDMYDGEKWYGKSWGTILGSKNWTRYEITFTTPNKTTEVTVFPALVSNKGEVWLDEVSLVAKGWKPRKDAFLILNWYTRGFPLKPFKTRDDLKKTEEAFKNVSAENFWGIIFISEEIYKTHIDFEDNVNELWFGERLLGYPLYVAEKPNATRGDWIDEMYFRMIRGFYNYFHNRTKVGITWGWTNPAVWEKYYGNPATKFIQQHYDFLFLYPYTETLEDFLQRTKPYISSVEELFPSQKKFWILTRAFSDTKNAWMPEAIALEMKYCLDRGIVVTAYHMNDPPFDETWTLMKKAIELYNNKATYYEKSVNGKNLLTGYTGYTYGWVQVSL